MKKTNIKMLSRQIIYVLVGIVTVFAYFPNPASAGPITARKVVLISSAASANTEYDFTFTAPTATTIQSVKFQACDTASGACTQSGAANGFSSLAPGSALVSQPTGLGSGGAWTVDNTDATSLRIKNASNTGNPSAGAIVKFNNVHNPTAVNSSFYIRITTFTGVDWVAGSTDTGVIATSTAGQITVTASVDETLTFTLATATIALGTITPATSGTDATHTMAVATNAASGYTVTYAGTTLMSGATPIPAMSGADYVAGTPGFGFNLVANTTPALGTNASGGTGTAQTGYGTPDSFKFLTGDPIAAAGGPSNLTTYTFTYVADIGATTPAGAYSTVLTYTATANF